MLGEALEYKGFVASCKFCELAMRPDKADFVIWVQKALYMSGQDKAGFPSALYIYRQNRRTGHGMHAQWKACIPHTYQAYMDMQYTYADEVKETERTDRWLDMRDGRI